MHRGEYTYVDPDGNEQVAADIAGNYFNLDAQAEIKGWTDEEKELVANRLIRACSSVPGEIKLYTKPAAPLPWAKYDEADPKAIATIAEQIGAVEAALAYERENKNRSQVVKELEAVIQTDDAELAAV